MTNAPRLALIWAQAEDGVIGRDGGMPWHVPEDLAHFKQLTLGSPVIMGRATWDAFPPEYRPLPGRRNIVVTRNDGWSADGAERAASLDEALGLAAAEQPKTIWVIGGGKIFARTIGEADLLEVTELRHPDGFDPRADDVRAPSIAPELFGVTSVDPVDGEYVSRGGMRYRFVRFERLRPH